MADKKLLVIGQVWPEPTSSAAGWRMLELLQLFVQEKYEIHFACAATRSIHSHSLADMGIQSHDILLNDSSFDTFVARLMPDVVLFDRFMVEEQFGWRVTEQCPDALRVLDTEDLHFLRLARQEAHRQQVTWSADLLYTPTTLREIASIYRCDLSLIISRKEYELLTEQLHVPQMMLYYLPFFKPAADSVFGMPAPANASDKRGFADRQHVAFIGNFLHEPNWKTVQALHDTYWPEIRRRLPEVELHVYGAYASQKVTQLHNPKERFFIKGRADDARETLGQYRLLIAPILFGAGLKGKFVDAMQSGTPSVASSLGAEGMNPEAWPGIIADGEEPFAEAVMSLYEDEVQWNAKRDLTNVALQVLLADKSEQQQFLLRLNELANGLSRHRAHNIVGRILSQDQFAAKKYMSRWIEAKNSPKP